MILQVLEPLNVRKQIGYLGVLIVADIHRQQADEDGFAMVSKQMEIHWAVTAFCIVVSIVLIGLVDYSTGMDIRVYPLYFLPLSFAAWRFGRLGGIASSLGATLAWAVSNLAAGMHYSHDYIWILNALAQFVAFVTIALVLAWVRDVLKREQALSRTDTITGLPNIRAFYESVELSAASCIRHARPLTLAYIDIDNFKCVNDRYGHPRGDALLLEVASALRASVRATDHAARIGGDEFVICMPETSDIQARSLLERLHDALAKKLPTEGCEVSSSIGALSWKVPPASVEAMVAEADKLMYAVKKSGKNRVEVIACSSL